MGAKYYCITKGKTLVAFIAYQVLADSVEILHLETSSQSRRQGKMLCLLTEFIKDFKDHQIWLEVSNRNEAALKLYKQVGFLVDSNRPHYYDDGSDAVLMTRHGSR